jgi:hypothetical protein
MSDEGFAVLLELLMVSDPWPLRGGTDAYLKADADQEARKRGYCDWVEAYHAFPLVGA